MKNKKIYMCHVNECSHNKQGSCYNDSDTVTIALCEGQAVCPNFNPVDANKQTLIKGLYQVLVELLLEYHGDEIEENIRDYDLCTSNKNTVFMELDGGDHLQDICTNNEKVVVVVDAINVLKYGRVLRVTECQ